MMLMIRNVRVEEVGKTDAYRPIVLDPAGTTVLLETHGSEYPLPETKGAIGSAYAQRWQSVSLSERVSMAFLVSSLVAVFTCAAAGNSWRGSERLEIPQVPECLRSLTQRMKLEGDSVQRKGVEWIS